MGQLLASVAHELNNPLSVLTGHAAILKSTADPKIAQRAQKMVTAAERCGRIVRNFLALARRQPAERTRVALNQVVREAIELLAYQFRVGLSYTFGRQSVAYPPAPAPYAPPPGDASPERHTGPAR